MENNKTNIAFFIDLMPPQLPLPQLSAINSDGLVCRNRIG